MQKLTLILFLLCFTSFLSYAQFITKFDSEVRIVKKPRKDAVYKDHDVEVIHKKDDYLIYIYRMENDTIKPFRVSMGAQQYFDIALYNWDEFNGIILKLREENTEEDSGLIVIKGNIKKE
ncbi:MAG: hypothetical protein KA807_17960 [Prolixibacteraceae bacterium]|nr:hypothetical protein [Bacteroidia bacterium]MBP7509703.1 hypothetical protein [Prolixibacteraceae bacterium]